ncbi:MAG: anti-sigma factor [Solirubrobacteraceae bacterium]
MSAIDPRIAELIGAYVLGACSDEEAAAVREHMARNEACRREVESLLPVRDALLDAPRPAAAPSPAMRASILGRVREEATLFAAATDGTDAATPTGAADAATPAATSIPTPTGAVDTATMTGAATDPVRARAQRLGILTSRRALVGILAVLVVLIAVPIAIVGGGDPVRTGSPVIAKVDPQVAPEGTARVVREDGALRLEVSGMPVPREGRRYQVWRMVKGDPVPTPVLFDVDGRGRATATLPDVDGAEAFAVTDEPPGGSPAPTGRIVLTAAV